MTKNGNTVVRPYAPDDEAQLIALWNRSMVADPINTDFWRGKVLLDPDFDPATCPVAEHDGKVIAFCLGYRRRVPYFAEGLAEGDGWITGFGVDPDHRRRGVGSDTVNACIEALKRVGVERVSISPYVPGYVIPGVDVRVYAEAVTFLEQLGFTSLSRPLGMKANLTGFEIPAPIADAEKRLEADGLFIRPAAPADIIPVTSFARDNFSWDWYRESAGVFRDLFVGDPRGVGLLVAEHGEEVWGYAQFRNERFGPFGVREDLRGRGIGRVLLAQTLVAMRASGFHCAWFLWTSDQAARLYAQCGFEEFRRFNVMRKDMTGNG